MSFFVPDYIDPAIPLTRRQRQAIQKEAWTLWIEDWRNAFVFAGLLVVMSGSMSLVFVLTGRLNVWPLLLLLTVYGVIGFVAIRILHIGFDSHGLSDACSVGMVTKRASSAGTGCES